MSTNVMDMLSMKGKVVVVTGAAAGIGLAISEAMAEAGADVAMVYHSNKDALKECERLKDTHKVKVKTYQCDVADESCVDKFTQEIIKDFGHLDVFIANAGSMSQTKIEDLDKEEYDKVVAINMTGVVNCAKYAGRIFRKQQHGNFIITASMSGHIVNEPAEQPIYNASKAFVRQLGKSLAHDWKDFARVNTVSPGYIESKMGASGKSLEVAKKVALLGRQGKPHELKGAYLFLASDASSFATGTDIIVDGGYTTV